MIDQTHTEGVNFLLQNVAKTNEICKDLFSNSPITFFAFARVFDDGSMIDISSSGEYSSFFYEKGLYKKAIVNRIIPGINYVKKNKNPDVSFVEEVSVTDFDITNKLDCVQRGFNYSDTFIFGSSTSQIKESDRYYVYNQDKILKFISYFTQSAEDIIAMGYKHKFLLPNYECPIHKIKRHFHQEMSGDGYDLGLSAQEFLVLILYAGGSSAKQISDMLYKSVKTVETYVARIKEKTGYKDRRSFNMLVYERGWSELIGFFLPYMATDSVH